jgi:hypothetical protein
VKSSRVATIALAVGASLSSLMGVYHFFIPTIFHWGLFVRKIPSPIRWGLFSINFFFSYLLLAGGILTFLALRRRHRSPPPDRDLLIAMAGFWLANTLYQLVIPMPLPSALWVLHVVLITYAMVATLAYVAGVIALRNR